MLKKITLFLFISLLFKNINALECYVTDPVAFKTQGVNVVPTIKNCKVLFEELGLESDTEDDFRCATIVSESDNARLNYQVCLGVEDTCDDYKNLMKSMESAASVKSDSITCQECRGNRCNSGITRTFEFKNGATLINKTQVYFIVISLGIGLVVLIVLASIYFTKCKTQNQFHPVREF